MGLIAGKQSSASKLDNANSAARQSTFQCAGGHMHRALLTVAGIGCSNRAHLLSIFMASPVAMHAGIVSHTAAGASEQAARRRTLVPAHRKGTYHMHRSCVSELSLPSVTHSERKADVAAACEADSTEQAISAQPYETDGKLMHEVVGPPYASQQQRRSLSQLDVQLERTSRVEVTVHHAPGMRRPTGDLSQLDVLRSRAASGLNAPLAAGTSATIEVEQFDLHATSGQSAASSPGADYGAFSTLTSPASMDHNDVSGLDAHFQLDGANLQSIMQGVEATQKQRGSGVGAQSRQQL